MRTVARRVAKLEAASRPAGCRTCAGQTIGVMFRAEGPESYAASPDGSPGPLHPNCPACKRRMPKLYIMADRAMWDGVVRP